MWSYASAINPGAGKEEAQDSCIVEVLPDGVVAAVSDGAGSARFGKRAAEIACQATAELGRALLLAGTEESLEEAAQTLVCEARERMTEEARRRDVPTGEFSCTLVVAVIGPSSASVVQVGDGAVVWDNGGRLELALVPDQSEHLNESRFVVETDSENYLRTRLLTHPPERLALFSDGLQHMIVDPQSGEPHAPFFERVFATLKGQSGGRDEAASVWVQNMLQSEHVTSRTSDDTSLMLLRRHG